MKKIFLGSTALIAAAAFTAPAMSAERLQLQLRGYHIGSISYTDGDFSSSYRYSDVGGVYGSGSASGIGDYNEINFGSDSEVHFRGATTLDNGLEISFRAELELEDDPAAKSNADVIDEVYVQVDGGFGRIQFGQQDGEYCLSVADNGLWTHTFSITADDLGSPIAATVLIDGALECSMWFWGICFISEWSPDLDARLIDPNGQTIFLSECALNGDCGTTGQQETIDVMPTIAGDYRLEVYPFGGSPNNGQGGGFWVDLFTGPAGGATPPGGRVAHR